MAVLLMFIAIAGAPVPDLPPPPNTWVKLTPLPGGPTSPRLGYEGACAWDSKHHVLLRYGGHNQGGGGEQHSEVWTFDPRTARWVLKEPNTSPPGVCCAQQDVFDPGSGRFLRFPAFSGSHGWQWWREIYLNDSSLWTYDLAKNQWRDLRPLPAANPRPLRCASWDSDHEVVVLFGGEGSNEGTWTYDPFLNAWTQMRPAKKPEARSGGNMAYDEARRLHILFGSQFSTDRHTWAYDLAKNEWRDLAPEVMPPVEQNDAVLAYDPLARLMVAVVKVTEGEEEAARHRLETWTFDAGTNHWKKMNPPSEPDPSGNRARVLVYAPEFKCLLLENRTHPPQGPAEQQIWAYRPTGAVRGEEAASRPAARRRTEPPRVEEAVVSVLSANEVEIAWAAPALADIAGYHVERAAVEVLSEDQLKRLKSRTAPLAAPSAGAIRRIGPFTRLTQKPDKATTFTDRAVDLTKTASIEGEPVFERRFHDEELDGNGKPCLHAVYAYRVRTVGREGVLSGPSPPIFTIPSAPQWLLARESGSSCDLKWTANPEKGLRSYRVYRMDGRYDSAPIQRHSAGGTSFTDSEAGKETRRYYIVAVDSLGQEGFPSAPVWFNREWKKFYEPFTGEWHQ